MRSKLSLLAALFCAAACAARADYLFTWNGSSNLFHGGFEVTDAEVLPGSSFGSPLFDASFSITSPEGITYGVYPGIDAGSFGPPFHLEINLYNNVLGTTLEVIAGPPYGMGGIIREDTSSGYYIEDGYWSYSYVPEPSAGALLAFGAVGWLLKRKRLLSAFRGGQG